MAIGHPGMAPVPEPASDPGPGELVGYRHPNGMTLPLPAGWERSEDPRPDVVLIAVEPAPPPGGEPGFRPNLVVTVDQLPAGLDLEAWQAATEQMLPSMLTEYLPIDLERLEIGGVAAFRRLAHHRSKGGTSVTMEQWTTVLPAAGGASLAGWSLTASTATPAYASLAEVLAEVAGGWRPPGHPGAEQAAT